MAGERIKSAAIALVIAVFVLGVAVGGLGMYLEGARVFAGRPAPQPRLSPTAHRARVVDELTSELVLTADQQNQLRAILEQTGAGYKSIHDEESSKADAVRQKGREQIRAILTPDQLPKF
ncbi:MAG TPA: hypothetical protein VFO34_04220, partial [Candidatus Acidoferrales bacterium]|nr:hypothetical protein [Candidatus Acidoferrales bacterium]